ncbi:MAG TPA: PqqD family protein, partial [Pyrinomonadaceae bacterium]|nr:PqqD family protein [Pyrinomonadaceae bacterium]
MKNQKLEDPTYRIGTDVCFSADQDGTIVLDIRGGKFHSLIQTGSKVWSVLATHPRGVTQSDLVDHLMAQDDEFAEEQREDLELAIQRILRQLTNDNLVETGPAHPS